VIDKSKDEFFLGFVVIPEDKYSQKVAVIYPDFTYQAYNKAGKHNLYSVDKKVAPTVVNYLRPSISNGWYHDPNRVSIEPFLLKNFSNLSYAKLSNSLVHFNPSVLEKFDLVILFGHDEYWTVPYFNGIKSFMDKGGDLLNLSGNTSWWITEVVGEEIIVDKRPKNLRTKQCSGNWYNCIPEESLLGMSWKFAGYPIKRKFKNKESLVKAGAPTEVTSMDEIRLNSINIVNKEHAIFEGLPEDMTYFGNKGNVLAIEFDGAPLFQNKIDNNKSDALPKNLSLLGTAWSYRKGFNKVGVMVEFSYSKESNVMSFGSMGWVIALNKQDEAVEIITKNAINILLKDK